jgi:hypothetical protein
MRVRALGLAPSIMTTTLTSATQSRLRALEPMVSAAQAELSGVGIDTVPEVVLARAGY